MTSLENHLPPLNGNKRDQYWMFHALQLAKKAKSQNEVPIGAVLVHNNELIGEGWNQSIGLQDPTAHAEILAIRAGGESLKNYRLSGTTLYVTLEPCVMCFGAMVHARIDKLVFATWDPKAGAIKSAFSLIDDVHFNHKIQWSEGILAKECKDLLSKFFQHKRLK